MNWEPQNVAGGRFVTRNEIDLPLELGPVKVVPYLLGEIGYWGQDINGTGLDAGLLPGRRPRHAADVGRR